MTFFNSKTSLAALVALTCAATTAQSDEAVLYDQAAPADAVFVRLLAEYDASLNQVPFGGANLPLDVADQDTYVAISASDLTGVQAGTYYSFASNDDGLVIISEPNRETAAKVHLILVNTSDAPVRLIVPGRGMEVVAELAPGTSASRAVNPVSTPLAVERIHDGVILGEFDVSLSRGQNLTFIADTDRARLLENSFGPVLTLN